MVVEIVSVVTVFTAAYIKSLVKKAVAEFEMDFDSEQLAYKLKRNAIICPNCSSAYIVQTFEEQLNDKWECPTCSCKWYETHSHDIKE